MKKVLVFAMILCMLALAMTGCSNGGNSTATESPPFVEGGLFFDFLRRGRSSSMRTEPARWPAPTLARVLPKVQGLWRAVA